MSSLISMEVNKFWHLYEQDNSRCTLNLMKTTARETRWLASANSKYITRTNLNIVSSICFLYFLSLEITKLKIPEADVIRSEINNLDVRVGNFDELKVKIRHVISQDFKTDGVKEDHFQKVEALFTLIIDQVEAEITNKSIIDFPSEVELTVFSEEVTDV